MKQAISLLQKHWGYTHLHPLQQTVIEAVMAGQDTLVLMPTGGGKSICFQLPTLLKNGLTLVVSPLIALMQDQVAHLKQRGIAAAALYTGLHNHEITHILDRCADGHCKLLYVSPEKLRTSRFLAQLPHLPVTLLAIDEAHCIVQWGHDFRPAYLNIANKIKPHITNAPCIALTATATPKVAQEIRKQLQMPQAKIFRQSFVRPELSYVVRHTANKEEALLRILHRTTGSAIVYATTRSATQQYALMIERRGISSTHYHAGLPAEERVRRQNQWLCSAKRVMVATNAFGMGIDKPDVRLVVHIDLPASLEAYYQEAGRAGRDRHKSYAVLLVEQTDATRLLARVTRQAFPFERLAPLYQALANYHQVAVGSHQGVSYPMDPEHFAMTYNFTAKELRQGLLQLTTAGLIQWNEQWAIPARLRLRLQGNSLYHFQIANLTTRRLIAQLIQNHDTTLFHTFCTISIPTIAQQLGQTVTTIHKQLSDLAQLEVVDYTPASQLPLLTFLTPRYPARQLPIHRKQYEEKQRATQRRAHVVVAYAHNVATCRTQQLVRYFGEKGAVPCAICDHCLQKQKTVSSTSHDIVLLCKRILTLLKQQRLFIHELATLLQVPEETFQIALQQLLKKGKVCYDASLALVRTSSQTSFAQSDLDSST